jgi:hypothetical protein
VASLYYQTDAVPARYLLCRVHQDVVERNTSYPHCSTLKLDATVAVPEETVASLPHENPSLANLETRACNAPTEPVVAMPLQLV